MEVPSISVELQWFEFNALLPALAQGKLDGIFTVGFEMLDQPHLASKTLEKGTLFVMVGENSPLAQKTSIRLSELEGATYYTMRPDISPNGYASILNFFLEHHFRPSDMRRLSSHESVLFQLQIDDHGYAFMSDFQFREHPGIVFIPLEKDEQPFGQLFDLVVAWEREHITPTLQQFITWLSLSGFSTR